MQCIPYSDKIITEVGLNIDLLDFENIFPEYKIDLYIRYFSQTLMSAFELTYLNTGTSDGYQYVFSFNDYRMKRIDFDDSHNIDSIYYSIYNPYNLLIYNTSEIYLPDKFRFISKSDKEFYSNKTLINIKIFFDWICDYYNIKHLIIKENTIKITKQEFIDRSKKYNETDWTNFNLYFNEMLPYYYTIMDRLEEDIFPNQQWFNNQIDKYKKEFFNDLFN